VVKQFKGLGIFFCPLGNFFEVFTGSMTKVKVVGQPLSTQNGDYTLHDLPSTHSTSLENATTHSKTRMSLLTASLTKMTGKRTKLAVSLTNISHSSANSHPKGKSWQSF
tara:strand:- start:403 stop:729 length:327 start_codon:yes stop_codon:yes gene_type:complete